MPVRSAVIFFIFGILLLGVIAHEHTEIFTKNPPPKTGQLAMFTFSEQELGRIEIIFEGNSRTFTKDSNGNWLLLEGHHQHHEAHTHSDEELGEHDHGKAISSSDIKQQIEITTRMIADRKMVVNKMNSFSDAVVCVEDTIHTHTTTSRAIATRDDCVAIASWGLDNPATSLIFYPTQEEEKNFGKPLAILYVGDMLPSRYTYYTRKDGDDDVYLVPRYFIAMILAIAFGTDQVPSIRPSR